MAKQPPFASTSHLASAGAAAASSKGTKRTVSEIDDIFAKKPAPGAAPPASTEEPKKKKKRKADKGKEKEEDGPTPATVGGARVPETIVDTSRKLEAYKVAPPTALTGKKRKAGGESEEPEVKAAVLADEDFMDSRGTTRRRTDDGLAIYDIAELKIGLGGDTELCPFDCQCCF